ncbi:hypothetical protein [Arcanobacterium haemolyticum]
MVDSLKQDLLKKQQELLRAIDKKKFEILKQKLEDAIVLVHGGNFDKSNEIFLNLDAFKKDLEKRNFTSSERETLFEKRDELGKTISERHFDRLKKEVQEGISLVEDGQSDRLAKKLTKNISDKNAELNSLIQKNDDAIKHVEGGQEVDKFNSKLTNPDEQKKALTDKRQELVNILAKKEAPKEPESQKPEADKPDPQNPDVKPELIYVTPIIGGVVPNASDPAACDIKPFVEITPVKGVRYVVTVNGVALKPVAGNPNKFEYGYGETVVVKTIAEDGYAIAADPKPVPTDPKKIEKEESGNGLAKTGLALAGLSALSIFGGAVMRRRND